MKQIVKMRMTIKDIWSGLTLYQMETYGVRYDVRTIYAEGRYFKAKNRSGFGKTSYIYEPCHKVIIDRIEEVEG